MRLWNHFLQASISAISTDLKRIQTSRDFFRDLRAEKPNQLVGQAAEFKFESKVIWQSLPQAIPKDNRSFQLQNQASWAALRHRLRGSRVCCSRCWKRPARLRKKSYYSAILAQFETEIQNGFNTVQIRALKSHQWQICFSMWNEILTDFAKSFSELITDQSRAHCFAQSYDHSLVSE